VVISNGKNERTLRVAVEKVVHVYEPEERCKDRALWESFREGTLFFPFWPEGLFSRLGHKLWRSLQGGELCIEVAFSVGNRRG